MSKYKDQIMLLLIIWVAFFTSVESTDCVTKSLSGREPYEINIDTECVVFVYENETIKSTSITRVVLETKPDTENQTTTADVMIEEYKSSEKKYARVTTWKISSNETFKKSHFGQNEKIRIIFKTTGNWSSSNISLSYEEIEFGEYEKHSQNMTKNEITPWIKLKDENERQYRPNTKLTFHIDRNESLSSSNILIKLNKLSIDKEIGEYLLIGAGSNSSEGPPPLCITDEVKDKKYLVINEAAYIVFVSNATRENYSGFNISWEYKGIAIKKPEIDEKMDVRKSAPICIYNITAVKEEIKKKKRFGSEYYFEEFRKNFAEVATNYTNEAIKIEASSVSVFRLSRIFKYDESHEALYAMVKITDDSEKGKAVFERKQLEEIISSYSKQALDGKFQDAFMFRNCGQRYVPESWFYFGLILLIPVVCFALLLWVWKQNPIAEHYEKKRKLKRASQHENSQYYVDNCEFGAQSVTGNPYTTLPKVQVTNAQGRRTTLNLSDMLLKDENASDDELFNKMHAHQRRSDVLELQRMKASNRLFLHEGEDNVAFESDEGNSSAAGIQQEDRAEHTYESLRSSTSLREDTKL